MTTRRGFLGALVGLGAAPILRAPKVAADASTTVLLTVRTDLPQAYWRVLNDPWRERGVDADPADLR